jgi:hypothetical protein
MKRKLLLLIVVFSPLFCHAGIKAYARTDTTTTVQKTDTTRDGSSFDKAIVINETSERYGDPAEYTWIRKNYPGATNNSQALVYHAKKPYDILHITTADGKAVSIYFDISKFFGKL